MSRKAKPTTAATKSTAATKAQTAKATITIDNKDYALESLSESAKGQLMSIRLCDQKIQAAQQEIALLQTARNAYARALSAELAK